jgi:hypothetical protein
MKTVKSLRIHLPAFVPKQNVQPAIAVSNPNGRQFFETHS